VASVSVILEPTHTAGRPLIAAGSGFTVTVEVIKHPVGNVYVIVALPADIPVTVPEIGPIVATPALLLAHVPPDDVLLNVVVAPTQTDAVPVIAAGKALTVAVVLEEQPDGSV